MPFEIGKEVQEEVKGEKVEETKLAPVEIKALGEERFVSKEQQTTPSLMKSLLKKRASKKEVQ